MKWKYIFDRNTTFNVKGVKFILLLVFGIVNMNFSFGQESTLNVSCSEGTEGRCVGSTYCTACTNCSRCGHCSSGGSCGVCSRRSRKISSPNNSNRTKSKKSSNSNNSKSKITTYNLPNDTASKYYHKKVIVNREILNLRSGPGTSYHIVERLKKGEELTFLAITGNWIKVKVNSTKMIGFVHYKLVLVSKE